jgi:hypothetical protein
MTNYINILLIILLFTCFSVKAQNSFNDPNLLVWGENYKLEWSDFQGEKPNNIGLKNAEASTDITIKANYKKGSIPSFIVINSFVKNESWTITDSESVLKHERLHFSISELFSRKIRKKFKELCDIHEKDPEVYINLYYDLRDSERSYQKKYDSEVYFNDDKQREWIEKIAKELEELEEFKYLKKD